MEWLLPEEFTPDFHKKKSEESFVDKDIQQALHLDFHLESESCRQRMLSTIREEPELLDE
jgi:hypothetical protein